jgi:hypothetical protein
LCPPAFAAVLLQYRNNPIQEIPYYLPGLRLLVELVHETSGISGVPLLRPRLQIESGDDKLVSCVRQEIPWVEPAYFLDEGGDVRHHTT